MYKKLENEGWWIYRRAFRALNVESQTIQYFSHACLLRAVKVILRSLSAALQQRKKKKERSLSGNNRQGNKSPVQTAWPSLWDWRRWSLQMVQLLGWQQTDRY